MNSERRKREQEIERLMRGTDQGRVPDAAFQEELRKAASAMVEEETRRIQKTERVERRKRSLTPTTAALWLLVLGAGLAFSIPSAGAALILCGIAVMLWTTFLKKFKK